MTFPFRFYGVHPREWAAAGEKAMFYELRFQAPPTPAQRLEIARRFETAVAESAVDSDAGAWAWSGDAASFFVGARRDEDEPDDVGDLRYDDFFDAMGEAFEDVHAAAPLREVVFGNARARTAAHDGGDWEEWSVAEQAKPSPAPSWQRRGDAGIFEPDRASGDAGEEQDDAFERERKRVRKVENLEPWWAKYDED